MSKVKIAVNTRAYVKTEDVDLVSDLCKYLSNQNNAFEVYYTKTIILHDNKHTYQVMVYEESYADETPSDYFEPGDFEIHADTERQIDKYISKFIADKNLSDSEFELLFVAESEWEKI